MNQEGDLLATANRGGGFTATGVAATNPTYDAAFTTAADMSSPIRVGAAAAHDANIWVPVQ
jgi:hypothetical protein